MELKGKVAIVTGASRGLGKAIATSLAENGANVVINYNNSSKEANLLKEELESLYNIKALSIKADVSKEEEVKSMAKEVVDTFGKIDILVNNAGIAIDSLVEDKKLEDFRHILDVNLIGPFICSREVSKYMKDNGYGRIINISSTNGIDTYYPYSLDYDASKAGLISLSHNLSEEYKPYINVNTICPGWIDTDMNKELDEEFIKEECSKIKLGRFAKAEEVAEVVTFLASPKASYINDAIIRVDGGEK